jgi:hypothetical protein
MQQFDADLVAVRKELAVICRELFTTVDREQRIQLHSALRRCIKKYIRYRERLITQYHLALILLWSTHLDVDYSIRYDN